MHTQATQENWDKKAQSFPRFIKDTQDTLAILDFFVSQGVEFANKVIFDIGCGNGRFALQLAFVAKKIYASDISSQMLSHLREDATSHQLHNIQTLHSPWLECDTSALEDEIDLGFASMTPALNNKAAFLKALSLGKEGLCYVGWGRERKCVFLDEILRLHHLELLLPVGLPDVLEWLQAEGYKAPQFTYKKADFTYKSPSSKAIEDIKWHIRIHDGTPDERLITQYVRENAVNGAISYTHSREIGIAFITKR